MPKSLGLNYSDNQHAPVMLPKHKQTGDFRAARYLMSATASYGLISTGVIDNLLRGLVVSLSKLHS